MDLLSALEVSKLIGKSKQTLILWDKQSEELVRNNQERLIPKPIRLGGSMSRYWTVEQAEEIRKFSENISYGSLDGYSRRKISSGLK